MALRVTANHSGGNVCGVQVNAQGDMPEIVFAAHPKGGTQALWFHWHVKEAKPEKAAAGKLRITMRDLDEWMDVGVAADLLPVYHPQGQGWHRCSSGTVVTEPDGRFTVSWLIPYPAPTTEVALCFPYGTSEMDSLRSKSRGYWTESAIGYSEEGVALQRWSNDFGAVGNRKSGVYLVAREWPGETPGAWVLDGLLQHMARIKRDPYLIWAVMLADPDAADRGGHGPSLYPLDVDRAWGEPPLRRETAHIQRDLGRWAARCKPTLVVDFHAAAPQEKSGVYCLLPDSGRCAEQHAQAEKWANVIKQELHPHYAAEDFKRPATATAGYRTLADYASDVLQVCGLTLCIPYSRIGTKVLSQKNYREIGEAVAKALIKR